MTNDKRIRELEAGAEPTVIEELIGLSVEPGSTWGLPRIPSRRHPGRILHVCCDGARQHVHGYSGMVDRMGNWVAVIHCSEPNCVVNVEAEALEASLSDIDACVRRGNEARERERRHRRRTLYGEDDRDMDGRTREEVHRIVQDAMRQSRRAAAGA